MPEKRDNIDAALRSKGFERQNNKDHYRYNLVFADKITHIGTKISRGSNHKTIGDNLLIPHPARPLLAVVFFAFCAKQPNNTVLLLIDIYNFTMNSSP